MTGELDDLQRWYEAHCDGDWEHTYGVTIGTLDNPGWMVDIELTGTDLEHRPFALIKDLESARHWIFCEVVEATFHGRGGPTMSTRILRVFLDWAHEVVPEK